jgi:hypothetical protein
MIYQQVTSSGDAEWPKVADAVIEAHRPNILALQEQTPENLRLAPTDVLSIR